MPRREKAVPDVAAEIPSAVLTAAHALALKWALKRVDYDTAHDLASDAAVKVWKRAQIDPALIKAPRELKRFVIGAVKKALLVHLRGERRRTQREAEFESELREHDHLWMCPEDEVVCDELNEAVHDILMRTPYVRRVAYQLVHEEELSYSSAAAQLKISPKAIESRVRRTRIELRAELAEYRAGAGATRDPDATRDAA